MTEKEFRILEEYVLPPKAPPPTEDFYKYVKPSRDEIDAKLEYDMDEEDFAWLELFNEQRSRSGLSQISFDAFECLLDQFEKDCFFHCTNKNFKPLPPELEHQADCAICLDGTSNEDNAILFCDMCSLSVHQKCYGVIKVPEEIWLCKRCLYSPAAVVNCCLCSCKTGALKRSLDGKWAHVVCAFWMPEINFGNDRAREPIMGIEAVPSIKWKLTCFVCSQKGKGACLQCQHSGCTTAYHASCAQLVGLTMKMEIFIDKDGISKKRVLTFCDIHSSQLADDPFPNNDLREYAGPKYLSSDDSEDDKVYKSGGMTSLAYQDSGRVKKNVSWKSRLKLARKILAAWIDMEQPIFVPVVTVSTINKITKKARELEIERHESFVTRLHSYWTLKRQSRDGYPLLNSRKFGENIKILNVNHLSQGSSQQYHFHQKSSILAAGLSCSSEIFPVSQSFDSVSRGSEVDKIASNVNDERLNENEVDDHNRENDDNDELFSLNLMFSQRLRQDLEKLRLLIELVRKRERLKMEQVKLHEKQITLQVCPNYVIIKSILDEIKKTMQEMAEAFEDDGELLASIETNLEHRVYFAMEDFLLDLKHLLSLSPPFLVNEINEKITNISKDKLSQKITDEGDLHFKGGICHTNDPKPIFVQMIHFGSKDVSQLPESKTASSSSLVEDVKGKRAKKRKSDLDADEMSGTSKAMPFLDLEHSKDELLTRKLFSNINNENCQAKKLKLVTARIRSGRDIGSVGIPKEKESFKTYRVHLTPETDDDVREKKEYYETYIFETKKDGFSSGESGSYYGDNERGEASEDDEQEGAIIEFKAYDFVWAKYHTAPWYPAMVLPSDRIPLPSLSLQLPAVPQETIENLMIKPYLRLVLFFDEKSTRKCIPANKLLPLGTNPAIDKWKLLDSKKISTRKMIQAAYDKALQYQQTSASVDVKKQDLDHLHVSSTKDQKQYHIELLELQQQLSQQIISESANLQYLSLDKSASSKLYGNHDCRQKMDCVVTSRDFGAS